jgi:hypothetical protein
MSKRITAENIKLKRAYDPALVQATALEYWSTGCGRAGSGKQMLRSICGPRIVRFDVATRKKYIGIKTSPANFVPSLKERRITLVFAAHDEANNDAVVLRGILLGRSIPRRPRSRSLRARTVVRRSSEATLHPFECSFSKVCSRCSRTIASFGNRPAEIVFLAR